MVRRRNAYLPKYKCKIMVIDVGDTHVKLLATGQKETRYVGSC